MSATETSCDGLLYSVLIVGCNRGLGLELVRFLLSLKNPPHHLFATCRDLETSVSLKAYNGFWNRRTRVSVLEMEVTNEQQIATAVSLVENKLDGVGLSLLINNAEVHVRKDLEAISREDMRRTFRVNAVAPLMIAKAFHSSLRSFVLLDHNNQQTDSPKFAGIVNISSIMGSISSNEQGGMYPYRASKTALNMITKCLSNDLRDEQILAIAIHPRNTDAGQKAGLLPYNSMVPNIIKFISVLDMSHTGGFYTHDGIPISF